MKFNLTQIKKKKSEVLFIFRTLEHWKSVYVCPSIAIPSIINKHAALIENPACYDVFNYGWSLSPQSSLEAAAAL